MSPGRVSTFPRSIIRSGKLNGYVCTRAWTYSPAYVNRAEVELCVSGSRDHAAGGRISDRHGNPTCLLSWRDAPVLEVGAGHRVRHENSDAKHAQSNSSQREIFRFGAVSAREAQIPRRRHPPPSRNPPLISNRAREDAEPWAVREI